MPTPSIPRRRTFGATGLALGGGRRRVAAVRERAREGVDEVDDLLGVPAALRPPGLELLFDNGRQVVGPLSRALLDQRLGPQVRAARLASPEVRPGDLAEAAPRQPEAAGRRLLCVPLGADDVVRLGGELHEHAVGLEVQSEAAQLRVQRGRRRLADPLVHLGPLPLGRRRPQQGTERGLLANES